MLSLANDVVNQSCLESSSSVFLGEEEIPRSVILRHVLDEVILANDGQLAEAVLLRGVSRVRF